MNKSIWCWLVLCCSAGLMVRAATQTVNGVAWTYTVTNGEASVGLGSASGTAVARTTSGALAIPAALGGYAVKAVAPYAFYECTEVTAVTVPASVLSIGNGAFYGCEGMVSASLPAVVTNIGLNAFYDCLALTNMVIPSAVKAIESGTFRGCSGLQSVTIPPA